MTNRERFHQVFQYGQPDRIPYFEEGIRSDVMRAWKKQGLKSRRQLDRLFPSDARDEIYIDLDPYPAAPAVEFPLAKMRTLFDPDQHQRWPGQWKKSVQQWRKKDSIRLLRVHRGFFLAFGVDGWEKFGETVTLLCEKPDYINDYLKIYGEFCAEMAERVLREVSIDAAIFSEPIGGKEGPLISPQTYASLILPSYKPVFCVLKQYQISVIILRTYANIRPFLPFLLEAGFNCLWACEPDIPEMDYRLLRKSFGKDLRLIGGLNIQCLREGPSQIRQEIENKVPALLDQGGYIPLADGRIRADISFENYIYYRRRLMSYLNQRGDQHARS